jgi:hypothetical protein
VHRRTVSGQDLLQRKEGQCACGGGCPRCQQKQALQTKLAVSQPGDAYEQEADRVAEQVMRIPAPALQRSCASCTAGGSTCPKCDEEKKALVQRKAERVSGRSGFVSDSFVLNLGPGQPLDPATRTFMEPSFGHDFSHVRVHTDVKAAESTRAVNALAFTVGRDVVFGAGQYAPGTTIGRRLLAHELAHVVQQSSPGAVPAIQRQLYPPVPIMVMPGPQPVVVNAVDARQERSTPWYAPWRYTGPLANFFRGDVTMTNISSMVSNVIAFLNGRSMHRLNVMDHGNSSGAEIGDDWLGSAADVATHAGTLSRLRPRFASGAIVHMQNCRSGQNQGLICALASAFGAPVYAGTGLQNPIYGFNLGDYVRCDTSGTFNPNAGRPSTPRPPAREDLIA